MDSKIPKQVLLHREEMASDLLLLAKLLEKHYLDTGNIRKAASQLKEVNFVPKIQQKDDVNYNYLGYDVSDINFFFINPPSHTHPDGLENITLHFDINLIKEYTRDRTYTYSDPLKHLEFNIVVIGFKDGKEHIISYHLDRHPECIDDPIEAHPKYHFQFGGRKLDKRGKDFGQSIILDSPRIMHYPMDIVLGIDFIVSNFFPEVWRELKKENDYVSIISEYKNKFLKPYFCSLANHWNGMINGESSWNSEQICPQLV